MDIAESRFNQSLVRAFVGLLSALVALAAVVGIVDVFNGDEGNSEVSWLYSQTSDSGEIDDLGGGQYRITLRGVDTHTIQFSDRPDRLVEVIDTAELVTNWDTLFETSSPNAVLVEHEPDGSTDSLVVVLEKPHFDYAKAELTYEAKILADEFHPERLKKIANAYTAPPVTMRAVSLFIDSVVTPEALGEPIFTGPFAELLKSTLGLDEIPTGPLDIGSGVTVSSVNVVSNDGGRITGDAVVGFQSGSFTLNMQWAVTDSSNWVLTVTSGETEPWSPHSVPGLTIDPASFRGTVEKKSGVVAFSLTGGTHSWDVADGARYVSTLSFTSTCPLQPTKCAESVTGPFISMNGNLTITGIRNPIVMQGAMSTNAEWARFDGTAGNITFNGTGVTDSTLTMWRGARSDVFDRNLEMPSLARLSSGNNLEFCGGFTLNIPKANNQSTSGCVRWSPAGVVMGQVGVKSQVNGTLPSTNADKSTTSATTADLVGVATTNIANASLQNIASQDIVMSGVAVPLKENTVVLAGRTTLPGVVADALNLKSGAVTSVEVDVQGSVSPTGFSLSGDIDTAIEIVEEPFKLVVRKMTAFVSVDQVDGVSFSVGTAGNATVGYSPKTRTLQTSIKLVAATKPQFGMSLSVTVRGTASRADSSRDGLTSTTRLTDPSGAEYVWPDAFDIKGLNLWNMTVQIAFQSGSPALGFSSTSYLDPLGQQTSKVLSCAGPCDNADWMVGTFALNVSYANPCLAFSVESTSGTSTFSLDGGVMKAKSFAVGIAPNGCSIQSGTTVQSLPKGFAGFRFFGMIGDTTVEVATEISENGFEFHGEVDNLTLAGVRYQLVKLDVIINESVSDVAFAAQLESNMGSMDIATEFKSSDVGLSQTLKAELTDWRWKKKGTAELTSFTFATSTVIPTEGGCASFSAKAQGAMKIGSKELDLKYAEILLTCNGVRKIAFKVVYAHVIKWNGVTATETLEFEYPKYMSLSTYLYGSVEFSYVRHFSKSYEGKTFSRDVSVKFAMELMIDVKNPQFTGFRFEGDFEADRVSGKIVGKMDPGGKDFTVGGELRLNPSWAGVYHFDWGEM